MAATIRSAVLLLALATIASFIVDAQQPQRGEVLYTANGCYQCHGYQGQGGAAGPRIAPTLYPFEAFDRLVRHPPDVMPAYSADVLNDRDLRAIYAYIAAIAEPPPVSDIAILR